MILDKTKCTNPLFGRILTAMVTPFTEDGDVDYELAIKLSNYLFENGSDGIVLCGTTGESCLLYTSPSPRDSSPSRMPSSA